MNDFLTPIIISVLLPWKSTYFVIPVMYLSKFMHLHYSSVNNHNNHDIFRNKHKTLQHFYLRKNIKQKQDPRPYKLYHCMLRWLSGSVVPNVSCLITSQMLIPLSRFSCTQQMHIVFLSNV